MRPQNYGRRVVGLATHDLSRPVYLPRYDPQVSADQDLKHQWLDSCHGRPALQNMIHSIHEYLEYTTQVIAVSKW